MGLFKKREPVLARVLGRDLACLICTGRTFWDREIKVNTTGMELLDLGWANQSSLGLVCATCGYVHEFLGDNIELFESP